MVEVVAEQGAALALFTQLGFGGEALLVDHVRDRDGRLRDLMVLAHHVPETWSGMDTAGLPEALGGNPDERPMTAFGAESGSAFGAESATAAPRRRTWLPVALTMFAIGWGANQFVSLLVAYRERSGLSVGTVDALVGTYALGLIPALLVLGPVSDRSGRAPVLRGAALVSLLATAVLMVGDLWALYAGRLLAGLASGAAFAAGSAWVQELSAPRWDPAAPPGSGARRAAMSLTAGFGLGPVVAGLLAQWAPAPLVTAYVPHLLVGLAVLGPLWRSPETAAGPAEGARRGLRTRSAGTPAFRGRVAPVAPWVFGTATVSIAVLPGLVTATTSGWTVAFNALIAGVTLGAGFAVQPLGRWLAAREPRRGVAVGLAAVTVGLLVAAGAAASGAPALVVLAAVVLGSGYGCCLVAGLLQTQRIALPGELAGLTAVYYALTYLGFAAPVALAGLAHWISYPRLLLAMAGLALLTLVTTVRPARVKSAVSAADVS